MWPAAAERPAFVVRSLEPRESQLPARTAVWMASSRAACALSVCLQGTCQLRFRVNMVRNFRRDPLVDERLSSVLPESRVASCRYDAASFDWGAFTAMGTPSVDAREHVR